jgi:hypothetical protein
LQDAQRVDESRSTNPLLDRPVPIFFICSLPTAHRHTMRAGLRVHALIGQPEPLHRAPVDQVFLHNLRSIFGLNVSVPDRLGVYHHGWTVFALIKTARLVNANRTSQACGLRKLLQLRVQFALAIARARWPRGAFRARVVADKYVVFENWQTVPPPSDYRPAAPIPGNESRHATAFPHFAVLDPAASERMIA